ncbi:MAG: hypothetical protein JXA37_06565 [Chloroflexia bacterium]|nr:hypothetical protein [Chloroflexia bacterium]
MRRSQPAREIVLVEDGSYAAVALGNHCRRLHWPVKLVSRLRLDARRYDLPGPRPQGKRGPTPQKGLRQPSLATRLQDAQTRWHELAIPWYGGQEKKIEVVTDVSLWYRAREEPLPIRWVLIRCPDGPLKPQALFCTDTSVTARQIVLWLIARWGIGVTFESARLPGL